MNSNKDILMSKDALLGGFGQVEITPHTNIHTAGEVGWFRPAKEIYDPIYAKAMILKNKFRKICLVVLDLTIVNEEWVQKIREAAADKFNLEPAAVMVHATQNHTAPSLGHFMFEKEIMESYIPNEMEWLGGGDSRYFPFVYERIIEAIKIADSSLKPVDICAGSGIEGRVQFNRRAVTNDGSVRMPGPHWQGNLGPTYIRYIEGPIDPEVGVLCIKDKSQKYLGMLLHHTAHPVNVFPKPVISADWPGAWAEKVIEKVNNGCVPLVINGCCGNINPWDPFDPDYKPDHKRMGSLLSKVTENVLETVSNESSLDIDFISQRVRIPFRKIDPEILSQAKAVLNKHPRPIFNTGMGYAAYEQEKKVSVNIPTVDPEWMWAANIISKHVQMQREEAMNYEIQVFRVGRTAIVGLPGEPFVEGQLRIKMQSPADLTYIAHCCNMYCGYIPTKEAFSRGGHEIEYGKLVPESLDIVVDQTTRILKQMFSDNPT